MILMASLSEFTGRNSGKTGCSIDGNAQAIMKKRPHLPTETLPTQRTGAEDSGSARQLSGSRSIGRL